MRADETLAELETDKVTLEVNAPAAGVLAEILAKEGETVAPGALLGQIAEGAAPPREAAPKPRRRKPVGRAGAQACVGAPPAPAAAIARSRKDRRGKGHRPFAGCRLAASAVRR